MSDSTRHFPPTVIVVHPKERRSKCSVEPLRGRTDFVFWQFPYHDVDSLKGYVRLGLGGERFSSDDANCGLLVLDGTWKLAQRMESDFAELPVRSIGDWVTAYPRHSKLYNDPAAGLATIEAVFAALHELGRPTEGLLDEYHWKAEFLIRNQHKL